MSYNQPALKFASRDFSGGYLDTPEADTLPPSSSPDAKNCLLMSLERADDTGKGRAVLRKRLGCALVNPAAIALGKTIDGLFEYVRETTSAGEMLAVCNGALSKFDNVNAFAAVTNGGGFTAGNAARFAIFRNNALVCDGSQNLRYDGTQGYPMGFVAPTSAPTLVAGAGTLTGTYEGYAVWYDSTADHESSPPLNADGSLAVSAQVALVGQGRTWGKPTGAPPANVDKWRVYCRRVDTNERNYFRSAEVAIGTASVTETVSDGGRTKIGPAPNDNDVPPAFALMAEFKGFRLGVKVNSSDLYVSKQFDAESQHPNNVFPVGGKGDGKPVRCVRVFGDQCLVQKPRKSYWVIGDKLPFKIDPIKSSLGNVSQEAGLEVRDYYYGWDEIVGPYRTNLDTWEPIADNRVANTVASVNRLALDQIRAEHDPRYNLILWIVPTTTTRKRTILAWNYVRQCWLPPITGFEYSSISQFTTSAGALGVYVGDYWGRVYLLFSGDVDGVPSGTTSAAITAATNGTITAAAAAFYTTGAGLAGMPAAVVSPAGVWQWVRVQSNTGTVLTLDTTNGPALNPVPDGSGAWTVYVGAIEWYWRTPKYDHGSPEMKKIARWFALQTRVSSSQTQVNVSVYLDQKVARDQTFAFTSEPGGLVWGVGKWGVDLWGSSAPEGMKKHRLNRSYFNVQLHVWNYLPNQPIVITAFSMGADPLRSTSVASA